MGGEGLLDRASANNGDSLGLFKRQGTPLHQEERLVLHASNFGINLQFSMSR